MKFDFDNERPIYMQLTEILKIAIVSGQYALGSRLPSVRELALTAKVNPNTIQKSLIELENAKLIYTDRTNGKYVTTDDKLLAKIKKELAKDIVNKYLTSMSLLGINYDESIDYLQELGGKK